MNTSGNKTGIRLPALPCPAFPASALTPRGLHGPSANKSRPIGARAAVLLRNQYRNTPGFVTLPFARPRFIPVAAASVRGQNRRQKDDLRILKSDGVCPCGMKRIRPAHRRITCVLHLSRGACGH
ncbi:hypothetical protein PagCFBP13532_20270 [Pantoea agglomerans]|nr:hypothetical protein PagCFBP13505_22125 [Pantoea agglomerans]TKK16206.1 hypothetical protein PagCFBP13516_18975 [Pantoea agglomerans]TKK28195.1 hypothetical protein PagCFBP13532_20270 [Pantoea agglomerans]